MFGSRSKERAPKVITHVQDASTAFINATSYPRAYGAGNTAGNLLIAFGIAADPVAVLSILDTNVNIWTPLFQEVVLGQTWAAWFAIALPGANTVTISKTGAAASGGICLGEWGGVDTVDLNVATANGNSAAPTTGSGTPGTANELLLAFFASNGGSLAANAPFVDGGQVLFGGLAFLDIAWDIIAAIALSSASATSAAGLWVAKLVSFSSGVIPPPPGTPKASNFMILD